LLPHALRNWEQHFSVDPEHRITGLTSVGRATIEKLRMNSARQIAARRLWAVLKIFP